MFSLYQEYRFACFLESNVFYETHCSAINTLEKPGNNSPIAKTWQVTDLKKNSSEFDSVIVTVPTPQLLHLKGSIQDFLHSKISSLETVQYSSRYAVALYFAQGAKIDVPWTCKYVVDSPCIRFISVDSRKRFGEGKRTGLAELDPKVDLDSISSNADNSLAHGHPVSRP